MGSRSAYWLFLCSLGWLFSGCNSSPSSPSEPVSTNTTTVPATTTTSSVTTTSTTTTTMSTSEVVIVREATFQGANGYITEGTARIRLKNGEYTLALAPDFRTSSSAALDVRLCADSGCRGDLVILGMLEDTQGPSRYPMADDGSAYDYVVIYCIGVRLPFGFGRLR